MTATALGMPLAISVVPSIGSTATSHSGPSPQPTSSPLNSIGASSFSPSPMTTTPRIETVPMSERIASTAAPSPPFLSPRPTQRPAAMAAASVTRTSSSARLRSGASGALRGGLRRSWPHPTAAVRRSEAWSAGGGRVMRVPRRDYDPADLGSAVYPLLNSVVVPRPIAWVTTRSATGVDNLAPHSFFTISSVQPPVVQFTSVGAKDSLRNAVATGEFVVSLCPEELVEQVNLHRHRLPGRRQRVRRDRRHPRAEHQGGAAAGRRVARRARVPRSSGRRTSAATRPWSSARSSGSRSTSAVLRDGRPEVTLLKPLARLGANEWSTIGEISSRRRVPYAELREQR